MVIGESKAKYKSACMKRKWLMGSKLINEVEQQKHVGIILNKYNCNLDRTNENCKKLRGAFASIIGIGVHPEGLSPLRVRDRKGGYPT